MADSVPNDRTADISEENSKVNIETNVNTADIENGGVKHNEKNGFNTESEPKPKIGMDLDTILVEEIGQFGLYQLRTLLLAIVVVIFAAWAAVEYIFTTSRINTRCLIPECETLTSPAEFRPSWIANAVPPSGSSFDNCQRFLNTTIGSGDYEDTCPAYLFDPSRVVDCEEYVYENTYSVAYDYGLACDEWRRSLIGSARTAGVLLATPLTGYVSDRWGRRVALTINAFNTAWLGIVRYWADTYAGFVSLEVIEAVFGSGAFSCAYILVMELTGPKYRVAAGATINTFFAVGQVTMGLIAWGVRDWRKLTLALYIPQLITITYIFIMSESVRWYMSKGKYEKSEEVLRKIAKVNNKQLSEKSLELLRLNAEEEKKMRELNKEIKKQEPLLIVKVFHSKPILLRCIISPFWWITTTFIYYGLSINSVNLSGNRYLNYIIVAAVEIPGYWASFFLMGIVGRKPVLTGAFWVCAACQFGYIFMPDNLEWLSTTLYMIGKLSIAMVMTAVYVFTAELYPTEYRHSLFAFSSMMGRIGSILAPLTPALGDAVWTELPFLLFAAFALVAGSLVLLAPETLGTKLPDTMEEAAALGKKKSKH